METREPAAIRLIERLEDASYSDHILLGHQNAGHIGVSVDTFDGSSSDIKNLTGKQPAVAGIDTLSFYGYEGQMDDLIKVVKQLHKDNVIITLSAHMPNFSLGGKEFYDYSPNITEGNVGTRILPGGDLNTKYRRFLDDIAQFAAGCIDIAGDPIPMIFRPFHECNGDWFWWGSSAMSDEDFITLYRYTADYLRDECGIRSFVYAYSPNGLFRDEKELLKRYPGDEYVDIVGMDLYHDRPCEGDGFFEKAASSLEILHSFCQDRGKISAWSEAGLRTLDSAEGGYYEGLAPEGNTMKDWFTRLLSMLEGIEAGRRLSYILFWANFSATQFWVPYVKDGKRHEMCDGFIRFCNSGMIKLAGE